MKLANSHIIPEFAYSPFYDEKHRLKTFEGDGSVQDPRWFQKGLRDYLLCRTDESIHDSCEGKLSKWESHAASVIGPECFDPQSVPQKQVIEITIKYAEFKLYGMSLIWRLAATSHPNFSIGSLGRLQEDLRLALMTAAPKEPDRFPFFIQAFVAPDGNFYTDWMSPPLRHDFFGKCAISMVICGFVYTFLAQTPVTPPELLLARPTLSGILKIPVRPISAWPEFEAFYIESLAAVKRHGSGSEESK